jgi:hypothetical protein
MAEDAEMTSRAAAEGLHAYRAELGTHPRVFYKNLDRWNKAFVSGSVAFRDTDECAEGAKVVVAGAGVKVGDGVTNNYGEFVIDGLDPGGEYQVTGDAPGYQPFFKTIRLDKSINLGTILLDRS